jgi:hypothetical protein
MSAHPYVPRQIAGQTGRHQGLDELLTGSLT